MSLMFIYLAHSMQPKTPVTDMRPYKVFGISGLIAVALFLILTSFVGLVNIPGLSGISTVIDMPIAIAVALCVATAPAAIVFIRANKKKSQHGTRSCQLPQGLN